MCRKRRLIGDGCIGLRTFITRSNLPSKRRNIIKMACMNVQGCNNPAKRECVGRMFEERGLGVLVMTETKLRGRRECSFGRYVGRISGVSSGWVREGVGIIVSDEWMKHVTEWKEVSSRIM